MSDFSFSSCSRCARFNSSGLFFSFCCVVALCVHISFFFLLVVHSFQFHYSLNACLWVCFGFNTAIDFSMTHLKFSTFFTLAIAMLWLKFCIVITDVFVYDIPCGMLSSFWLKNFFFHSLKMFIHTQSVHHCDVDDIAWLFFIVKIFFSFFIFNSFRIHFWTMKHKKLSPIDIILQLHRIIKETFFSLSYKYIW